MINNGNSVLYQRVRAKGFRPSHVAEIGVWHPNTSNIYKYIQDGVRTTLVKPDPESINLIKDAFNNKRNVSLHEIAVCDFNGDWKEGVAAARPAACCFQTASYIASAAA